MDVTELSVGSKRASNEQAMDTTTELESDVSEFISISMHQGQLRRNIQTAMDWVSESSANMDLESRLAFLKMSRKGIGAAVEELEATDQRLDRLLPSVLEYRQQIDTSQGQVFEGLVVESLESLDSESQGGSPLVFDVDSGSGSESISPIAELLEGEFPIEDEPALDTGEELVLDEDEELVLDEDEELVLDEDEELVFNEDEELVLDTDDEPAPDMEPDIASDIAPDMTLNMAPIVEELIEEDGISESNKRLLIDDSWGNVMDDDDSHSETSTITQAFEIIENAGLPPEETPIND